MQPITTSKLLLATASLVFLVAGCGSSGGGSTTTTTSASATQTWASGVCSAITTWQAAIKSAAASVTSDPTKNGLQAAAADAKSATENLSSDLKGLGKPGTQAGQQAKDSLDQLSTDLQQGATTIGSAVEGVSSVSDALSAAPTVTDTLKTMQTQIKTTIKDIQGLDAKGELKNAFANSAACDSLTSGTA
jgi:methyl-accepting chemotaxis protein